MGLNRGSTDRLKRRRCFGYHRFHNSRGNNRNAGGHDAPPPHRSAQRIPTGRRLSIRAARNSERASEWLDEHPELLAMVGACVAGSPSCGRRGLTCETILRCAVLIHLMGYSTIGSWSPKLIDSASTKRFARIDPFNPPKRIGVADAPSAAIAAATWQAINGVLVQDAKQRGTRSRERRCASTRLPPTRTSWRRRTRRLLFDGDAGATELLRLARQRRRGCRFAITAAPPSGGTVRSDRSATASGEQPPTGRLLRLMRRTIGLRAGCALLADKCGVSDPCGESWCTETRSYLDVIERVVRRPNRRVFDGETVPAGQKVVSLFEPHVDIIVQGRAPHAGGSLRAQDQPEYRAQCAA